MTKLKDEPTATTASPWKSKNTIEDNPVGLPKETAAEIAPHLDQHVASFYVLFHQYQKHHWLVEGPQFRDLHHFLEKSYFAVQKAADAIAERMTAIGAIPTSAPAAQAELAYVQHEPEGLFRIRDMLTADRRIEGAIAERLRLTIPVCTQRSDFATETLLKKQLLKVEDRAHELDHFLGHDTLSMWGDDDADGEDRGVAGAVVAGSAQSHAD
jgi:DNA-binding ferritin-like protein